MTSRKHESFAFNPDLHDPSVGCWQWCRIHWYYHHASKKHMPLPDKFWFKVRDKWQSAIVHIGPPAWYPKRPDYRQWEAMRMECPHHQADLTCNTCLRHTFRPWEPR